MKHSAEGERARGCRGRRKEYQGRSGASTYTSRILSMSSTLSCTLFPHARFSLSWSSANIALLLLYSFLCRSLTHSLTFSSLYLHLEREIHDSLQPGCCSDETHRPPIDLD
ncbi:hypothetical protein CC85DRAFT_195783 [Cutaneotrichosporon oleaginosum]|uniref:Uncharacterized protein n=1 Tax=Cutaneotrichosporon oleaginosum TaxID=879819 RepID=A0A0J0XEI6_9TREE|nr:uncharacterized protein CC85DRAFT_195783 [Cutaneotrichosporon oleaginosum]KLT39481.1 hypothetical protein CC85DRAFT_195783 [Cutaneotrichosporon oleaginosum]TXT09988.1 hypothetical protein COLE_03922 [Cutaneotrichosporon oleaginosum]